MRSRRDEAEVENDDDCAGAGLSSCGVRIECGRWNVGRGESFLLFCRGAIEDEKKDLWIVGCAMVLAAEADPRRTLVLNIFAKSEAEVFAVAKSQSFRLILRRQFILIPIYSDPRSPRAMTCT